MEHVISDKQAWTRVFGAVGLLFAFMLVLIVAANFTA